MGIVIVLDPRPRYKLKLLEYFFPKLLGSSSSNEINSIKNFSYSLFENYQAKTNGMVGNSAEKLNEKKLN